MDRGNPSNPDENHKHKMMIAEAREIDLIIFKSSQTLVKRHITLYNPKK